MALNWRVVLRKAHRYGAILTAIPFVIVIVTGLLLQLKKEIPWVQPPTQRGISKAPTLSFKDILDVVRLIPEAGIKEWSDVDRIDIQPSRGMAKVTSKNRWELQIDLQTGEVLSSSYRRSDLIESLHDGSWFHDSAKLWIFLPSGVIVFGLWMTGLYLFFLPLMVRWRRKPPSSNIPTGKNPQAK